MIWHVNIPSVSFSICSFIPLYFLFKHIALSAFQYNENHFFLKLSRLFSFLVMVLELF
jgi:hypothetical protein